MIGTDSFLQKAIEEQINDGLSVTLCVTGKSMLPYISRAGDEFVVVSKHQMEDLKPGTIIFFSYNNKFVFHRIIDKKGDLLVAQGDGNCVEKEIVKPEDVLGVVRFVIRSSGKKVSTNCFMSQIYWRVWYILRPIRKYLLFLYNRINK